LNNGDKTMKRIMTAVIIMVLIPISYIGAEDKRTMDSANLITSMSSEGYPPLQVNHAYYFFKERMSKETEKANFLDCIEGQRRTISYSRMSDGKEITKPHRGCNSTVWVVIRCMEKK
jgi:hypothetical protein